MVLSYLQAFRAKNEGKISWLEYLDNLLARLAGNGHDDDDIDGMHQALLNEDPFGYCIFCWSQRLVYTVKDKKPIREVFEAYQERSMMLVTRKLAAVQDEYVKDIRKALAFLALQDRRADVLQFCLRQGGFPFEGYFVDEANRVNRHQDERTFAVLEDSEFRKTYPRKGGNKPDSDSDTDPAEAFDEGCSHPVDW